MRTTAVYGSGKFGAADRLTIADRDELSGPFQAEMLSVWLTRAFSLDLVEHIAAMRGGGSFGRGHRTGLCAAVSAWAIPPGSAWRRS